MSALEEYHRLMESKTLKPSKKVTRDTILELEAVLEKLYEFVGLDRREWG